MRLCACTSACVYVCGVAFTQVTPDHHRRHGPLHRRNGRHHRYTAPRPSIPANQLAGRGPILDSPPPLRCVRLVGTDHPAVLATKYVRRKSRRHRPATPLTASAVKSQSTLLGPQHILTQWAARIIRRAPQKTKRRKK